MNMKWANIILMSFLTMFVYSCGKDDKENTLINHKWELVSITSYNQVSPEFYGSVEDPYLLLFTGSSTFQFNTSSNKGGGNYRLEQENKIDFEYGMLTIYPVCPFDSLLMKSMNAVNKYTIKRKTLILQAGEIEIKFKRLD